MATASLAVTVEARERGADDAEGTLWLTVLAFGRVADELARHSAGDPRRANPDLARARHCGPVRCRPVPSAHHRRAQPPWLRCAGQCGCLPLAVIYYIEVTVLAA